MTLWGGRFEEGPAELLWRFTVDNSDRRLLRDDIRGSLAHAGMLAEVGILTSDEASEIRSGLETILAEADAGEFEWSDADEDVHSAVERRLYELIGATARASCIPAVPATIRYVWICGCICVVELPTRAVQITDLVRVLADLAEEVGDTVVASYTHLQQAQAVPLAHHLLAYAWMLLRDRDRFQDAYPRIDISPLGAGASAGSRLPLGSSAHR